MPQVLINEAPGGLGEVYQCGYCGMTYLSHAVSPDGEIDLTTPVDPPKECRRCKAPMDYDEVVKPGGYSDQRAEAEAGAASRLTRKFKRL